jgi:hypothetical protein
MESSPDTMMRNARRRLPLGLACAAAAGAIAVGVAACGSGEDSTTGSKSSTSTNADTHSGGAGGKRTGTGGPGAPPKSRPAHPRHRQYDRPPGSRMRNTYPARIIGHDLAESGPIQPAELWPVRNGWRVSDHKTFTAVYAGADPQHRSTGRLVVFRQNYIHVKQTSRDVDVDGTGPLRIIGAPSGKNVGTSAQRRGNIRFRGANGATGTLHLNSDTITLSSPGSQDSSQ